MYVTIPCLVVDYFVGLNAAVWVRVGVRHLCCALFRTRGPVIVVLLE